MNPALRRELANIIEGRVVETTIAPERVLVDVVTALATKTAAYRKDLSHILDKADELQGKLPGFQDSLEHMVGALEMSDKMLEDLVDATLADARPYFKRLGLSAPRMEAKASKDPLSSFLDGFYKRNINLRRFQPKVVLKTAGVGPGGHPEARQHGDEVWLYPKFWALPKAVQDHTMAHELGHWVSTQLGTSRMLDLSILLGLDLWDSSALPFGQTNMEEAFAEMFAEVHRNPTETRKKYPAWATLVDQMIDALP